MEIILLEDVAHLGNIGELVSVKPGYARNYLLPRKLAVLASTKNKAKLAHEQRVVSYRLTKAKAESALVAKQLDGLKLTFTRRVGDQDKLFGSVTSHDIADALVEKKFNVERRRIHLPDPIKALGEFKVQVKLRADVNATLNVEVVAEA